MGVDFNIALGEAKNMLETEFQKSGTSSHLLEKSLWKTSFFVLCKKNL